ncbi:Nucleoside diphosphate kinase [Spraguea lophii 42_110]|uniref:Nucleoside diphosphate kinase n=1 Tax=Spraguea lophii (strain 42_110) TaxID=1358809 RepID=S7XT98_SPRLO|nr:Nucleoside diphosphate kinase [Spraguea lophii 42_110]
MEKTFVMIKPEGVNRRLIGQIISRFEQKGLHILTMKCVLPERIVLEKHYAEHKGKGFYENYLKHLESGRVVPMVLQGNDAVFVARKLIGATNPKEAEVGTIRGDFGLDIGRNIIHGADSLESADREIGIWFGETVKEIQMVDDNLVYEL